MIYYEVDPAIKVTNFADICKVPVSITVNKFDEAAEKQFAIDLELAENTKQSVIPIYIHSFGGQVYSLLSMIDILKQSKKPIVTICSSKSMSCGAILFSCGKQRFMSPNATIMIHDVSSMAFGKVEEIKVDAAEADRLNKKIYTIMARNCGHPDNYFMDIVHEKGHADWFLDANEALSHNLATHIKIPNFKVKLSLDIQFE